MKCYEFTKEGQIEPGEGTVDIKRRVAYMCRNKINHRDLTWHIFNNVWDEESDVFTTPVLSFNSEVILFKKAILILMLNRYEIDDKFVLRISN